MVGTTSQQSAEQLYQEREQRITDAIQLKVPDRVPMALRLSYFPAKYAGITTEAAFYDPKAWREASKKLVLDMDPDCYASSAGNTSGEALEILGAQQIRWPGHGVSPYHTHQTLELEPMKEDEYDAFFNDPSDFMLRTYMPRVWTAMAPFGKFPVLRGLAGATGLAMAVGQLASQEFADAFTALGKAAQETVKFQSAMAGFPQEMAELGYPSYSGLASGAPFDVVSDNLRGMKGAMMDMYKRPDELVKLCEILLPLMLERTAAMAERAKNKRVFMALHRGSDGFMSLKQFETFYWPTFKKVVLELVQMGLTPCPFFEGIWDARLEYLLELPKGKVLCHFAQTDLVKAKEVLGGHLCFTGDVPSSILQVGSTQDVEEYCKKQIDVCGKDGGFIMTHMPIDDAEPANVKAMVDITRSYGVYA